MDTIILENGVEKLQVTETTVSTRKIDKQEIRQDIENIDYEIAVLQAKKLELKNKLNLFK
jgi:hypothetical protein